MISVVVPNYNHARFLPERLDSIFGQTLAPDEVILLDDASTDESREILKSRAGDPRVQVLFNEKNSGSPFRQWQKGVEAASGKYVWIAESDDYASPQFLERLSARLDRHSHCVLAYCQSHIVDAASRTIGSMLDWTEEIAPGRWATDFVSAGLDECRRYMIDRATIPNASAVLFRREAFLKAGGAHTSLRLSGDWLIWARLARTGMIAFCANALNYFRETPSTVRRSTKLHITIGEEFAVRAWIARHAGVHPEIRGRILKVAEQRVSSILCPGQPIPSLGWWVRLLLNGAAVSPIVSLRILSQLAHYLVTIARIRLGAARRRVNFQ